MTAKSPKKKEVTTATKSKQKFNIHEKIKKVSKNASENSIKVYVRSAKRFLKLTDLQDFPTTSAWIFKKPLLSKYDKLPLEKRRSLSVAAVKLCDAYGLDRKKTFPWVDRMNKASDEYSKKREKREWSEREKKKKPEKGWRDVIRITKFLLQRNKRFFKKSVTDVRRKDLYNMQRALIWQLFKAIPLRLTYADIHIVDTPDSKKENIIYKSKKGKSIYKLRIRNHKTKKFRGELKHDIPRSISQYLNKFIAASKKLNDHDYLLSNLNGSRMTKSGLSKYLTRESAKFFGNAGFSAGMIRVLFATENRRVLEQQNKVSEKLGHNNAKTSLEYTRKDD